MATGVNKVILIGNLGRDPEIQHFENGVKKASFSLATTEAYKNKEGEKTTHTEWHNIILWRGLAEVAEKYLKKGQTVYIEGRIRKREWEDENKQKRYAFEIMGDAMQMLGGSRRDEGNSTPVASETREEVVETPTPEDDLPF